MQNNILRPSALDGVTNASIGDPPHDSNNVQLSVPPNLQEIINGMVESAVGNMLQRINILSNEQQQNLNRSNSGEYDENSIDQVIEDRYKSDIDSADKIPDVVRCLRDFAGNPCEFSSWRKSIDRVLDIYSQIIGTPKYFAILSVIRNEIVGEDDVVLESYNTPLNWKSICKCLTLHYADKRDVSTLEFELMSLVQGIDSIEDFYKNVYHLLSLILNKISCMEVNRSSIVLLTKSYRDKALETFVRGLKGDLPRLLTVREPTDLPQALKLCQKLNNQQFFNKYSTKAFRI